MIWLDNDTGQAFVEKGIWLKAALEGGTMRYNTADFKALSAEYRIKWKVESANGMHRLGLTFVQLKFDLAMDMLNQILNETRYIAKDLILWRKQEIYHYNYYKNDPDSLINWWISGQERYFKTLEKAPLENSNGPLITILGRPQIVSSLGRIDEIFIKQKLFKIVRTKNKSWTYPSIISTQNERKRNSSNSFLAVKIWDKNPLQTNYLFSKYRLNTYQNIESERFSMSRSTGFICFKKNYVPIKVLLDMEIDTILFYKERVLINYYLWLEYNKNEALANAFFALGIWENDMVEKFKNSQIEDSVISFYKF